MQDTVLVVDPNPASIRRAVEAFEGVAYAVATARDAQEVQQRLQDLGNVRLLLTAASLPRGNGYELARGVRRRFPDVGVLLLTSGFEVYNQVRAEECGVSAHVAKPFTALGLREKVEATFGTLPLGGIVATLEAPAPLPPVSLERVATLLPQNHENVPLVRVDPDVVAPALEQAILQVLPEVVQGVLPTLLTSSPQLRALVQAEIERQLQAKLPEAVAAILQPSAEG